MKRLSLLAVTALTLGAAAPVIAADLPARPAYSKAPAIIDAAYDWSGFYIGLNGGGASSRFDWIADPFPGFGGGDEGSHNATGGTFGGQFGYRWQMASWVFGLEAQGNWANFSGSNLSQQFANTTNQSKINAFGLFTGQVGYAWDRALVYAKGGAAVTDNGYSSITTGAGGGFDAVSETRWGASVGLGLAYAFAPNWSLGFEYNHMFMGNRDVISPSGFIANHIKEDVDLFTARIDYRFGGPVVARY